MDLMLLITEVNMLAKKGKVQQAFKLINSAQLRGTSEKILDTVFDKIEYNSLDNGFLNTKYLPYNHNEKDHYVREIGPNLTRSIRKSDIFMITNALARKQAQVNAEEN